MFQYIIFFQEILSGRFQVVFVSPESILGKYRSLLKSKTLGERLVAVAIDESHCIKKW